MNQLTTQDSQAEVAISVKEWIIMLLIFAIPLVNIIMMFVWAFDKNIPTSKSNFCKAYIIFTFLMFCFTLLLVFSLGLYATIIQAIHS
ncbi:MULTISPECIES: hypothetical protein [Vitreoscilla]|uniref:Uncharacterized protein n=1 Tax=Vitreoscilla stercoraria TaxID=61 RepID=A0ABY4E744_VITST|nr:MULTISPECIES: hypothetical protein [Vitreoscilla]QJQ52191.1 hypothetical protein ADP71_40210 [Vitreoscilla sp. C1]UOO91598.1 hypothetical protein LVJ81_08050 [Vitreoscilla stercoraria]